MNKILHLLLCAAALSCGNTLSAQIQASDSTSTTKPAYSVPATRLTPARSTAPADSTKKKQTVTVSSRKRTTKQVEYPTAIDNSESLLQLADSLAIYEPRKPYETMMFLPIVFNKYEILPERKIDFPEWTAKPDSMQLVYDREWLDDLKWAIEFEKYQLQTVAAYSPWLVPYNMDMMPEAPKQYEAVLDVSKNILTIEERKFELPKAAPEANVGERNWMHNFDASVQFSQAYLSDNWYQGGNKNLNMISNINYFLQLNQKLNPNYLYELSIQYKVGLNSAPDDELRDYSFTDDIFQINTRFGVKATKKFYYSMNFQFKTQLFQSFKSNTWDVSASFLTPGEFNAGVGMTYSTKNERGTFSFDASLSPVSYNMKICRANQKVDPTGFGIDAGKHLGHEIGSSGECKLTWNIARNIALSQRLFIFSDYGYIQGDLEATLDFSVNKWLSTRLYAHLRYDDSAGFNDKWQYWQFKEIFSFGLQYKFKI